MGHRLPQLHAHRVNGFHRLLSNCPLEFAHTVKELGVGTFFALLFGESFHPLLSRLDQEFDDAVRLFFRVVERFDAMHCRPIRLGHRSNAPRAVVWIPIAEIHVEAPLFWFTRTTPSPSLSNVAVTIGFRVYPLFGGRLAVGVEDSFELNRGHSLGI